jgi:hypothetical protein
MKKIKIKMNSWIYIITVVTFIVTIIISYIAELLMGSTDLVVAIFVVLTIILTGVIFDTIGVAVAAGSPEPFHAMAASRIKSAKYSLMLLKNASKVSNFLNDVIGDIAGIVSGAGSAVIVIKIMTLNGDFLSQALISTLLSASVACLTVGGKAIGKEIALNYTKEIVDFSGRVMYFFAKKNPRKLKKNK